jgi:hypothetical protein
MREQTNIGQALGEVDDHISTIVVMEMMSNWGA